MKRSELVDQLKMLDKESRWRFVQANLNKLNPIRREQGKWWYESSRGRAPGHYHSYGRLNYQDGHSESESCLPCWEYRLQKYIEASHG